MELIRKTRVEITKNGNKIRYAIFKCLDCFQEVERCISNGKRDKSCGCQQYSEEKNNRISKSLKGKKREFFTEKHRQNLSKSLKGKKRTEEQNKRSSFAHKGKHPTEKTRNKMSKAKEGENNPFYGKKHSEGTRQKLKISLGGRKLTIEHKKNIGKAIQGVNHWNWQNGKSFEEYPKEFKQIKKKIYERDNYECQNPECNIENPYRLDCHHIDYDKTNNNSENLTTLCISCHSKTHGKKQRIYWTRFYQKVMEDIKNVG